MQNNVSHWDPYKCNFLFIPLYFSPTLVSYPFFHLPTLPSPPHFCLGAPNSRLWVTKPFRGCRCSSGLRPLLYTVRCQEGCSENDWVWEQELGGWCQETGAQEHSLLCDHVTLDKSLGHSLGSSLLKNPLAKTGSSSHGKGGEIAAQGGEGIWHSRSVAELRTKAGWIYLSASWLFLNVSAYLSVIYL